MTLYDRMGNGLRIELLEWQEILMVLRRFGWAPGATGPPPSSLMGWRQSWDGSIEAPEGQVVNSPDARALAQLLQDIPPEWLQGVTAARAGEIAHFCQGGAFLLIADSGRETRTEAARARQALELYPFPGASVEAFARTLRQ